jgi:hypothetical protein
MHQPLSLEQLKAEAHKRNHRVIRRDGEAAWRPLKTWKGQLTGAVVYYLLGNRVLEKRARNKDVNCYTLE